MKMVGLSRIVTEYKVEDRKMKMVGLSRVVTEYEAQRSPLLETLRRREFDLPELGAVFECANAISVAPGEPLTIATHPRTIIWNEEPIVDGVDWSQEALDLLNKHQALLDAEEENRKKPRIAVCICTRGRPQMFKACLESVLAQAVPHGTRMEVIVVSNDAHKEDAYDVVADVCQRISSNSWVTFVHEPVPGISQARNAALGEALARGADWIAFLDDDEVARPDWLVELYASLFKFGNMVVKRVVEPGKVEFPLFSLQRIDWRPADAAHGVVKYKFPADAPSWRCRNPWGDWGSVDGEELDSAGTGNVIFKASIVKDAKLSFDEALGLKGGEDDEFFKRFHDHGGRIVLALHAVVTETVPWERITVKGYARKSFRNGVAKVEYARRNGDFKRMRWVRQSLRRLVSGAAKMAAGAAPFALGFGGRTFLSGVRSLSEGAGNVTALLGKSFDYYKSVTGS